MKVLTTTGIREKTKDIVPLFLVTLGSSSRTAISFTGTAASGSPTGIA